MNVYDKVPDLVRGRAIGRLGGLGGRREKRINTNTDSIKIEIHVKPITRPK